MRSGMPNVMPSNATPGLASEAPFRFACACGHRAQNPVACDVTYVRYVPDTEEFLVECPDCAEVRPVSFDEYENARGDRVVCVVAGRYDEHGNTDFWGTPAPRDLALEPRALDCPKCGAAFTETALSTGPEHPEVGWEYYECPDCNAIRNADAVLVSSDEVTVTGRNPGKGGPR